MTASTGNRKFVATGGGIVVLVALIIVVIWFIVTKANQDANSNDANRKDSTSDTTTKGIMVDSLRK